MLKIWDFIKDTQTIFKDINLYTNLHTDPSNQAVILKVLLDLIGNNQAFENAGFVLDQGLSQQRMLPVVYSLTLRLFPIKSTGPAVPLYNSLYFRSASTKPPATSPQNAEPMPSSETPEAVTKNVIRAGSRSRS